MWSIRILKGPNAGEKFDLKLGDNIIGRGSHCDICISTPGVSKEHAKIVVTENSVYLQDLDSTNGTFVNGIKISRQKLRVTDKVSFFDTIASFENSAQLTSQPSFPTQGSQALQMSVPSSAPSLQVAYDQATPAFQGKPSLLKIAQNYIDSVLLPGVYKLAEIMEFRWVVALMLGVFIFLVTLLSTLPMAELTKSSIQKESQRRAMTLAKSLAEKYQIAVKEGVDSTFNASGIAREEGVSAAFIISSVDGTIIAPASRAGQRPDEAFVHTARKQDFPMVSQINDSTIGASMPIKSFDSNSGSFRAQMHSIVLYDMGSLAFDSGRTLSLFIQVLAISFLVGSILFFFLFKLIQRPFIVMNQQIDQSLKDGQSRVHISYIYPELQDLIININTAMERAAHGTSNSQAPLDRHHEASQLVANYPQAAIAIDKDFNIISMNPASENLLGLRVNQIRGQNYVQLNDQALILNLKELFDQVIGSGFQTQSASLEFSGNAYQIFVQAILSERGVSYFLISFTQNTGGF